MGLADAELHMPEWMLDEHGYRRAVPPEGFNLGDADQDFRAQVLATAATEAVLAEIRYAYLNSKEMRALYATFDLSAQVNSPVQRALQLHVDSSRRYTRIRFPNCPQLAAKIRWILGRHHCQLIADGQRHDLHYTITVPRLGQTNEHIELDY